MKTGTRITLAAALGAIALTVSQSVLAHDYGRHDGHRGHGWGHSKHHHGLRHDHRHHVMHAPVLVYRPAPVYYERRIHRHNPPPAVVVGVQVPPLVVRLY